MFDFFLWGEEDIWKIWDRDNKQLTRNSAFYLVSHLQSLLTGPQVPFVLRTDLLKVLGQVSLLPQDVCCSHSSREYAWASLSFPILGV